MNTKEIEVGTKLNALVAECTAFNTIQDMVHAMNGGYVPTIRTNHRSKAYNKKCAELREILVQAGYKVF